MKCADKEILSAYLDGELSQTQKAEIRKHLEECEECRKVAAGLTSVCDVLDALEGLKPDIGFTSRLLEKVHDRRQVKGWHRVVLPAVATVAAVLSIALGVFLGYNLFEAMQNGTSTQNSEQTAYFYDEGAPMEFYNQGGL